MAASDERVDILEPPLFKTKGVIKTREEAHNNGDWIGTFNLWIFTRNPEPSIVYQQRSKLKKWAPGMLDVAAGGHYLAGEKLLDGLREVEEELGKYYGPEDVRPLGRSLFVIVDVRGRHLNEVVDLYMTEDDSPLSTYKLQAEEVDAILTCPVRELLKVNREIGYSFLAEGLSSGGRPTRVNVDKRSFPENWNDYHYKMAVLADRYFGGETNLLF